MNNWVREQYLGVTVPEPEPLDLPEADLQAYAGRYGQEHSNTIVLEAIGNRFRLQVLPTEIAAMQTKPPVDPPVAAALTDRDKLMILEDPFKGTRGEFLATADGRRWLRLGVRAFMRQEG